MDAISLAQALGFDNVTIVGTSMGGPVALWIARHIPMFCNSLVILNSHPDVISSFKMSASRMQTIARLMEMGPSEQRVEFQSRGMAEKMRQQNLVDVDAGGLELKSIRERIRLLSDDELFVFWAGGNHNLFVSTSNLERVHAANCLYAWPFLVYLCLYAT